MTACPCALVISVPVTVVSAVARAAQIGALVKGGTHLETLAKVGLGSPWFVWFFLLGDAEWRKGAADWRTSQGQHPPGDTCQGEVMFSCFPFHVCNSARCTMLPCTM